MEDFLNDINDSLATLRQGGVILYPTDTVWGLGADSRNEKAVNKLFAIKDRPADKSVILLLGDIKGLVRYVDDLPENIEEIISSFNRPTTVIYPRAKNLPENILHSDGSVAIRIVNDPFLRELIKLLGSPLISTSANLSGLPTPSTFIEIDSTIKEEVDYIVEYRQDDTLKTSPSRVIRLGLDGSFVVVRE